MTRNYSLSGFTLLEMISVILILSIVAVFAAPRLTGTEPFSVISARDNGLSIARQIQLRAMERAEQSNVCNALYLTPDSLGGSTDPNCIWNHNRTDIVDLSTDNVKLAGPSTIFFDLLGRPKSQDGQRLCTLSECKFTFTEQQVSASFCLNSEGFFYVCS